MSFNIRDYVSDDHIESIGEIAKSQSAIIQALSLENSKLETQLQQKENIIKEVRNWVKSTIDIIKQHPSEDDTWILERLNSIKQCLKGSDKE